MNHILNLDATAIAEGIRKGEYTSLEVTNTFIEHAELANLQINAITENRFEQARQEAIEADLKLKSGASVGKLHGVPISVKDCFHIQGMATLAGLPFRKGMIEAEDADVVKALKEEGAIVIAKTNTPPLCFCQETDNKLTGLTRNPWNLDCSAGGSSGGEGALMAVGGAAVGLGADIGGSIRFPSHFNGIVGFKSGNRQVSADGNFPFVSIPEQDRMLGIGAMGKSVRDAQLVNEIISGKRKAFVDLSKFRLIMPGKIEGVPLSEHTYESMQGLLNKLKADFEVKEEVPPNFKESAIIWQELMSINGGRHIKVLLSEDGKSSPVLEYIKERFTRNSELHHYLTWALIGVSLFKPSVEKLAEIRKLLIDGDRKLDKYFESSIVILPVYHEAAQKHGKLYKEIFSIKKSFKKYMPYIAYANVWGLPSLTVPLGKDEQGMPIGVQFISKVGNEDALFQFGEWFEENIYRYERCSSYDLVKV